MTFGSVGPTDFLEMMLKAAVRLGDCFVQECTLTLWIERSSSGTGGGDQK
jgi:hypothetical protein